MGNGNGDKAAFDSQGRFVLENYAAARPFASFLPGIAGPQGIPMWVFYVNRGQAVTSMGVESKDNPIMEFQPANKAYQTTPYTGFRTFIKLGRGQEMQAYEPFAPWYRAGATRQQMCIGMNELELQEDNPAIGLQTRVLYFILLGESFAGLVRRVTLKNISQGPLSLEVLDGAPAIIPFGVDNGALKHIGRTIEAWMEVFNLEHNIPFYRLRASSGDTAEVKAIRAGHFAFSFVAGQEPARLLPAFVDPGVIFGQDTAFYAPNGFHERSLSELLERRQITGGRTPCAFFGAAVRLAPDEAVTIYTVLGHASSIDRLEQQHRRVLSDAALQDKRRAAQQLAVQLTDPIGTKTSSPLFDAYCRQTFLDNVLRGGWPVLLGDQERPCVYHVYSRKHGDPERDYNAFYLAAEPYSQGNGNYRDVNQNRRSDVLFKPQVTDFNVRSFMGLIQADGYNPLVVQGSRFYLPPEGRAAVLKQVRQPDRLEPILSRPFTPGQLLKQVHDHQISLRVSPDQLLSLALQQSEQQFEALAGEGYWIDHWTYNLDLIDSYLAVYPERKDDLLFGSADLPFYDNVAVVRPRDEKHVLADGKPRQFEAVVEDPEKAALIASRAQSPHLMRVAHGRGAVYRTTLFAKLVCLALVKFATLDPWGMGIEMEAGRPGWYDAMNGLPGLFGSSLPESFELQRLLAFLLAVIKEKGAHTISLPVEVATLLTSVISQLDVFNGSVDPERDFIYWNGVTGAREAYREQTRLGFEGRTQLVAFQSLARSLTKFLEKVQTGIARAIELNEGLPPTYFAYRVEAYEIIHGADREPRRDENGRPFIRAWSFQPILLPLFLEGAVRAFKVLSDVAAARRLYEQVKASHLFDRQLQMYKVNASLEDQPHDIGRARAFTPGWLENESIWLHMEYKYLLEVLKAGLYEEFFEDFRHALIPFQDPAVYGRSPLENSSFIVSSAHPDESLHGAGFVARLSGATAEFLSIWQVMMAGPRPFSVRDGKLELAFKPTLPGWLFDENGRLAFTFLGQVPVTYHNPHWLDIYPSNGLSARPLVLHLPDGGQVEFAEGIIGEPHAQMVREGQITKIDIFFQAERIYHLYGV